MLTALLLIFDLFATHLLICWSMYEWKSKSAMHLLHFHYSSISFSRSVKTNFIGTLLFCFNMYKNLSYGHIILVREATTITWLHLSLYAHCTYIHSYTHHTYTLINHQIKLQGQMLDTTVQCSCVCLECTLLRFLQRVPIEWWVNESFV